jgi:hypothetical protein
MRSQPKRFEEFRKPIDADPARCVRLREHKAAMLADFGRALGAPAGGATVVSCATRDPVDGGLASGPAARGHGDDHQ